jgi:hypothetical protein
MLMLFVLFAGAGFISLKASGQTTVTISATGTTGSYKTGTVTSAGMLTDGTITASNTAATTQPQGWAVFDLSSLSLPAGAQVTAATLTFNKISVTGGGAPDCSIYGNAGDLSLLASGGQGSTLYTTLSSGTVMNTAVWSNTTGSKTLNINAAGRTFLESNLASQVSLAFVVSASNRVFNITGYDGAAADQPMLEITYIAPCAGIPDPATASGPAGACPGADFTLTATGATVAVGITYDWQYYDGTTWVSTGGDAVSYTVTGGISAATDYRLVTNCTNGGGQDISNTVSIAMNPATFCFCASESIDNDYEFVSDVSSGTFSNASGRSHYANYTGLGAINTVTGGGSFDISITVDGAYDPDEVFVYLDADQDGILTTAEQIGHTDFNGVGSGVTGTRTVTCTVPVSALGGPTGLRIKVGDVSGDMDDDPCQASYDYGEVEDYSLMVVAATACNGTPDPVTASGPLSACPGWDFTLTATGMTIGTGITYEWQYFDGSSWVSTGASGSTYTVSGGITAATDYQFVTTCANGGGQDISNTVSVGISPITQCYCMPDYTVGCYEYFFGFDFYYEIDDLTMTGETTSLSSIGTSCSAGSYADYSAQSVDLAQGLGYSIDITSSDYPMGVAVWIDFDDNGTFDAGERVGDNGADGSPAYSFSVPVTIPVTATLGSHRMRVRLGAYEDATTIDPCSTLDYGEVHDYTAIIVPAPSCLPATGLAATSITTTSADVTWDPAVGVSGFEWAVDTDPGLAPNAATTINTSLTNTPPTVGGLSASTTYYLHVRVDCGSGNFSNWVVTNFQTALGNDEAPGALTVVPNAGCTGAIYFNTGATQSVNEVYGSCSNIEGYHTVWFKFTAPASGAVRVSTDMGTGTLEDTRIALFEATNVNDYSTFNILSCDEDGGNVIGDGYTSVMFATGLVPSQTYYIQVDGYSSSDEGTFCMTVDDLSSSMLSTAGASCDFIDGPVTYSGSTSYTGWVSLLDENSNLVAMVRNSAGGDAGEFFGSFTINTSSVRDADGQYYLDRNYEIANGDITAPTPVDMLFFFRDNELNALSSAIGGPGVTLADLNVTHQSTGNCEPDFDASLGTATALLQTANGSAGGVNWIQVNNTLGFSNFYIMAGITPLAIELKDISAVNVGSRNRVDWTTAAAAAGDRFEVERSMDGKLFTKVGDVAAKAEASVYSFWDENPVEGLNHYRLKMTDASGRSSYSKVVTATVRSASGFSVEAYPNPVSDQLTVKAYGQSGNNATVSVCDITGKVISSVEMINGQVVVNMSQLAEGVYLIRYSDSSRSQTLKINKQ